MMTHTRGMLALGVIVGLLAGSTTVEPATRELVNTDSPQTLTNKTLVSPVLQGNVGIGTASPQTMLDVAGHAQVQQSMIIGANAAPVPNRMLLLNTNGALTNNLKHLSMTDGISGGIWSLWMYGNSFHITEDGSGDRLVIGNGGNVGIGTTTPASRLDVAGGCITGSMCSDARLKEDIRPLPEKVSYLEKVLRLRGVSFQWKDRPQMGRQMGLIAQEVEMVLPEAVTTPEGETAQKGLSCTALDAALVEALKEQQAQIQEQQTQLRALQQELAALKRGGV